MSRPIGPTQTKGFTLIEVMISMTLLTLGTVALATLLLRATKQATAVSMGVYATAAVSEEMGRLGAVPFSSLAAGTTCVNVTAHPLPNTRCTVITDVNAKRKTVTVTVTPTDATISAVSVSFERSISGDAVPPLNTP
jgi:prepilin-type N-terminal cleavage/methylation domain-containing protein